MSGALGPAAGMQSFGHTTRGGPRYGQLVTALKRLTDAVSASDPPDATMDETIEHIRRLTETLESHRSAALPYPAGHRWDLPARGHPLLIPMDVRVVTQTEMLGSVRFSVAHMGHPGLVHGGFIPLLFDEAFGVFPAQLEPVARTAALEVRYRAGTPIDTDLAVSARLERVDGRKLLITGELRDGERIVADSNALFIQPRPAVRATTSQ